MTILVSIFVFAAQYACFSLTEATPWKWGRGSLTLSSPCSRGAVAATAAFRIQNDVLCAPLQWLAGR